jgi:hypothetical protein
VGGVGEASAECDGRIPRVRVSFLLTLGAGTEIGGADKVHLFLKTVYHEERANILFELQDDDGAHSLTEDWSEVERVCRQHDASRSTMERPESGGEEKAVSGYAVLPEESSTQAGSEEVDLEALNASGVPDGDGAVRS